MEAEVFLKRNKFGNLLSYVVLEDLFFNVLMYESTEYWQYRLFESSWDSGHH